MECSGRKRKGLWKAAEARRRQRKPVEGRGRLRTVHLDDEGRVAFPHAGALHKVLEAVWEEARVHDAHGEVGDENFREDLVEGLLVVLLRVAALVVKHLLK